MSYQRDLTTYSSGDGRLLNVGWLDRNEVIPKGETSQEFRDALTEHIKYSAVQTMGRHRCNLCREAGHEVKINLGEGFFYLGSCEIRVFAENDITYTAPNLIYHYVINCDYLPPRAFIEAVIKSPRPPSCDYIDILARRSVKWRACPLVEMVSGKPIWMPPAFYS